MKETYPGRRVCTNRKRGETKQEAKNKAEERSGEK